MRNDTAVHFVERGVIYGHVRSPIGIYINRIVPVRRATWIERLTWLLFRAEPTP